MTAISVTASAALLCVRTADTFFTTHFCAYDIEYCQTDDQRDRGNCDIVYHIHLVRPAFLEISETLSGSRSKINVADYAFKAYSAFSSLFFLMIITVKIAAMARTIAQPMIGIQTAPKLPPVKSVPKKNTRKPTV